MKRILNLSCIAGKGDLPVVDGDFIDHKPMLCQPAGNPGQILPARPKTGTIFGRSEPLMVRGRMRIVLCFHQRIQRCLLRRRRFELKHHVFQRRLGVHHPLVKVPPRHRMYVSLQGRYLRFVNPGRYPIGWCLCQGRCAPSADNQKGKKRRAGFNLLRHSYPFKTQQRTKARIPPNFGVSALSACLTASPELICGD